MKSRNSVFPKFIKQYNKGNNREQSSYGSCLRLMEIHAERPDYKLAQYYRDGGDWSGAFEMGENGVLTARTPEVIEGKQAVACTYREWKQSNGHFAVLSKEEQKEYEIIECTCEGCGEKFKAEEKDFYCCSGYDSIGEPTCGCKGQQASPIVCSETCYLNVVKSKAKPIDLKMKVMYEDHSRLQDMLKKKAYDIMGIPLESNWYDIFQEDLIIVKGKTRKDESISLVDDQEVDWPVEERRKAVVRGLGKFSPYE